MRVLHIAAKVTRNRNREHLKRSLSIADREDLERVQKAAVKVILGKNISVSVLDCLQTRFLI